MATSQHILVIEDHEVLNTMFCRVLSRAGHLAHGVTSAEDVQEYPDLADVSVFVIDWSLPDESGVSLLGRLRRSFPQAAFIMVTARSGAEDQLQAYANGAEIFLSKPIKGEDLLRAVDIVAGRKQIAGGGSGSADMPVGSLYRHRRCLEISASAIDLSISEMKLLTAFACARDRVLKVWQIAEIIDVEGAVMSGRAIEVRLSRLRKKLSGAMTSNPISFVKGEGYQLMFPIIVK